MSGTPGHSGGARPNSGRKTIDRLERIQETREEVEDQIRESLPDHIATIKQLASGGLQVVTEHWQLAGTILVDAYEPVLDADDNPTGKTVRRKVQALPGKAPDEIVLVSREVRTLAPNLAANAYLVNRVIGLPTRIETPEEVPPTSDYDAQFEADIERIYGDNAEPWPNTPRYPWAPEVPASPTVLDQENVATAGANQTTKPIPPTEVQTHSAPPKAPPVSAAQITEPANSKHNKQKQYLNLGTSNTQHPTFNGILPMPKTLPFSIGALPLGLVAEPNAYRQPNTLTATRAAYRPI
jgi:hypothetical protein